MPRPVSWLPRLHEIRRSVENSVRSHYDRRSIEILFKLQPSAASSLMEMLPKVEVGRAHMVERQALERFLNEVHAAEDVTAVCIQQRAERENVSRKLPRSLVLSDCDPIGPADLAPWIERGRFKGFDFEDPIAVFEVMLKFAAAVQGDRLEEFCRLYVPPKPVNPDRVLERADALKLREEIEQMEADWVRLQAAKVPA